MLMTGASFIICFGLLTAVGIFGKPSDIVSESEESYVPSAPALLSVRLPLKGNIRDEGSALSTLPDGTLEINSTEDAERLLSFIEANQEAFLFSDSDNGWYTYSRSVYETETTDTPSDTTIPEDELWETEEWLEERTESPEGTVPSLPENTAPEKSYNNSHSETDCPEEGTIAPSESMESESLPPEDLCETTGSTTDFKEEATMGYQFSSTELSQSVSDTDLVYIISITTEEGKTVHYALDAMKYAELAERLNNLLESLEN